MYLGFDSSTQSLSGMIIDPVSGEIVLEKSVNFGNDLPHYGAPSGFIPNGTAGEVHSDPRMWLEALDEVLKRLSAEIDLSCVKAIGGSGQQHGSVYLDETFEDRIRNANVADHLASILAPSFSRKTSPIWMDTSTGQQCREMADAVGGNEEVCRITGSVAIERFTGSQIRKFYQVDPAGYANTAKIHLVSSFMCSVLSASHAPIDFGDGAGMNLMNLAQCAWDAKMLEATAPQLIKKLPSLAASGSSCGLVGAYLSKSMDFHLRAKLAYSQGITLHLSLVWEPPRQGRW